MSDLTIARLSRQPCYLEASTASQSCIAVKSQIVNIGVSSAATLSDPWSMVGLIVMIEPGGFEYIWRNRRGAAVVLGPLVVPDFGAE